MWSGRPCEEGAHGNKHIKEDGSRDELSTKGGMSNKKRRTFGSRRTHIAGGAGTWTEETVKEENGACSAVKAGPGTRVRGLLEGCGELAPHFP